MEQLDAGVHGLVLGGTLGEASTLREEEKSVLIKESKRLSNVSTFTAKERAGAAN